MSLKEKRISLSVIVFISCVFLLATELVPAYADEAKCTGISGRKEPITHVLRKKILCGNQNLRVAPNSSVTVTMFLPRAITRYVEEWDWLTVYGYPVLMWNDPRLIWDLKDFNLTLVRFAPDEIWTPELRSESGATPVTDVMARNDGRVYSSTWTGLGAVCKPIYLKRTLKKECTVALHVWPTDIVRLKKNWGSYFTETRSSNWVDVNGSMAVGSEAKPASAAALAPSIGQPWKYGPSYCELRFTLLRNFAIQDDTVFAPAAVLAVFLLTSTWMPAICTSRVAMLSLIVVLQVFMFHQACEEMPNFPDRLIDIVALYRDLILCSGAAIVEWLVAYILANRKPLSSGEMLWSGSPLIAMLSKILIIPTKGQNGGAEGSIISVLLDRITFVVLGVTLFFLVVILAQRPPLPSLLS